MKRLIALVVGIAIGAFATRQIQQNPAAKRAFEEAKSTANEFRGAIVDGYKQREGELSKTKPASKKTPPADGAKSAPDSKPTSK
jgi:hypothetical protein